MPVLTLLFVGVTVSARSQVAPAAREGNIPLTIGVGGSEFFLDWGNNVHEAGITAWADWRLLHMPKLLDGLGVEVEGRDINYLHPAILPTMRQDTGLGGAIYQWRKRERIRPYGKYLIGMGSIDFPGFFPLGTLTTRGRYSRLAVVLM